MYVSLFPAIILLLQRIVNQALVTHIVCTYVSQPLGCRVSQYS